MKANKQKITTALLMSTIFLTLSACGEFSYKRGASSTDFQQEKKSCATENKVEADVDSCLAKSGWIVVGLDKPLFSGAAASTNSVETISEETLTSEQAADPLELIVVGSWWKTGAAPNGLLTDSEQCVVELGKGHQTLSNMSLVTRGLVACMDGKGWFALKQ